MSEEKSLPKSDPVPLPNASTEPHPLESRTPINPSASHGDALQDRHEDPHHKHHLLKYFLIGMFFAFAVVAILVAYYLGLNKSNSKQTSQAIPSPAEEVACTMDVKECPDGSFVSRQGSACEFAECPKEESTDTSNWNTYSNSSFNFSFDYPSSYSIIDKTPKTDTSDSVPPGENLTLTDKNGRKFTIWVNPGGFGPFFANKIYDLAYSSSKGIYSESEEIIPETENHSKDITSIISNQAESYDGHNLFFQFIFDKNDSGAEEEFNQILSTFKFN